MIARLTTLRRLGDVCRVQKGTTITENQSTPGPIPVVAGGMRPSYFHNAPNRAAGTVTVSASGANAGFVSYWSTPIWASDCTTVEAIDPDQVSGRYVFHYLKAVEATTIASLRRGAAQPHVYAKDIQEIGLPLPPIEEQRRIASILDAADALRAKRCQALEKLDTLTQSIFIDTFGDPISNPKGWRDERVLGDIAEIRSGITKGRRVGSEQSLRDVPYLAVANVQDGHLMTATLKTISATDDEIRKFALAPGDIVLTEGGDPDKLGRGAVWDGRVDPCIHQNHIFRARVKTHEMTPEYLSALLGSTRGKSYFLRMAKQTTGIASINMTQLRSFPILEPPALLQRQYIAALSAVSARRRSARTSLTRLDDLFASLQHRAFAGGL